MIIIINRWKIVPLILVIALTPYLGVKLMNLRMGTKSEPAVASTVEKGALELNLQKNAQKPVEQVNNFFSEYRLERERVRGKELSLLREIANSPASAQKPRDAAFMKLVELTDKAEKEMQAEAMIKSQGFTDCAVVIAPNNTTVLYEGNGSSAASQGDIRRAVSIATGCAEKAVSLVKHQNK
jgi:stage III sporulation protein AH